MKEVQEKAFAKINLMLGVRCKRADGYHELDMLMQTISLYDSVTVEKAPDITVTTSGMLLPYNNTMRKAAEYYSALTGHGVNIRVIKRIPAQAGLGGGSADAAAVLRALDRLYGEVDSGTMREIALKVGADVPFCYHGGLCRAEGIGEVLTPIKGMLMHIVIVKPAEGVSTKALFDALTLPRKSPDTLSAMRALSEGDLEGLSACIYNALEEPAIRLVPEIAVLKERLVENGAVKACMTGSGSAVFGLFRSAGEAEEAAGRLKDVPFCAAAESV